MTIYWRKHSAYVSGMILSVTLEPPDPSTGFRGGAYLESATVADSGYELRALLLPSGIAALEQLAFDDAAAQGLI